MQNLKTTQGFLQATSGKYVLVVGRFNSFLGDSLVAGAVDTLERHGVAKSDIEIVKAPGAWEIPLAVQAIISKQQPAAVIVLGAVIRGGTPHFEYVAGECNSALSKIMLDTNTPVANGLLTVDSIEQGIERSGTKMGNKGAEAAEAALEMVNLLGKL